MDYLSKINKIRILGIDYGLYFLENVFDDNFEEVCGTCQSDLTRIEISNQMPESMKKATVLHEIIEALVARLDIQIDHHYIELLEMGLSQVINDNPELINWLQEEQ